MWGNEMDGLTETQNWLQYAIGLSVTVISSAAGVAAHLYRLVGAARQAAQDGINAARQAAQDGDKELWNEVSREKDKSADFRAEIKSDVARLPTKEDHRAMEDRIMAAIRSRHDA